MKKIWLATADRFDALRPRERLMVFLACVAVLIGVFVLGVLNPALSRYQQARQSLQQSEAALRTLDQQEVQLIEGSSRDPDQAERAQLAELGQALARLRRELTGPEARLSTPEKMSALLRELIGAQKNLRLVSIRSGEVEDLLAPAAASAPLAVSLYRHSVKLVLQGDYAAFERYLRQLEALPWQLEITEMQIKTDQWPQATLSLTLGINSLERAWLAF